MAEKTVKLFVLDTNVILHDSACLHQFKEHDIVIPITVIEELDKFKKGNETLNFHARHFLKELDKISSEGINPDTEINILPVILDEGLQ